MVLQAFEYEKRDNCPGKHEEFFESTKGKFNHPFVKNLVQEIINQRTSTIENSITEADCEGKTFDESDTEPACDHIEKADVKANVS